MAMTDEKVLEAFQACVERLQAGRHVPLTPDRLDPGADDTVSRKCHLVWMCENAKALIAEGRREKAMRWLGFVQGALWSYGSVTIADLKAMNRPADEDPADFATAEEAATYMEGLSRAMGKMKLVEEDDSEELDPLL